MNEIKYLCEHCVGPAPEPAYAANERFALWLKAKEIEALKQSNVQEMTDFIDGHTDYFSGKAEAFSNAWAYIVFDGKDVNSGIHPEEYNQKNEYWSEKAKEVKA